MRLICAIMAVPDQPFNVHAHHTNGTALHRGVIDCRGGAFPFTEGIYDYFME